MDHTTRIAYRRMNAPRPLPLYVPLQLGDGEWTVLEVPTKKHIGEYTSARDAWDWINETIGRNKGT